MRIICVLVSLLLFVGIALGDNVYLNATTCGIACNYDNAAIWVGGNVPTANDSVYMTGAGDAGLVVTFGRELGLPAASALRLILSNNIKFILNSSFNVSFEVNITGSTLAMFGNISLTAASWIFVHESSTVRVSGTINTGQMIVFDQSNIYIESYTSTIIAEEYVFLYNSNLIVSGGSCLTVQGNYTHAGGNMALQDIANTNADVSSTVRLIVSQNATFHGVLLRTFYIDMETPTQSFSQVIIFVNGSITGYIASSDSTLSLDYQSPYIFLSYTYSPKTHNTPIKFKWWYALIIGLCAFGMIFAISKLVIYCKRRSDYSRL